MSSKTLYWLLVILFGLGLPWISIQAAQPKSAPDPTATQTPTEPGECDCHYAVHILFECTGNFPIEEGFLKLSFLLGEYQEAECEPFLLGKALAECTLSLVPPQEKSANPCQVIPSILVSQLTDCLATNARGIFCVKPDEKDPRGLFIESSEPFHIGLCALEAGFPCDGTTGLLIDHCPVYNLLDGIDGNEAHLWEEFHSGIGIEVFPAVCPDLTPTETPIPTMTWTREPPPTSTFTPVPTGTPTNTLIATPILTPTPTEESPCVCDYAAHLIFSCTGQFPVDEGSIQLRFGFGAYEENDCEPAVCGDSVSQCTLSLVVRRTKSGSLCEVIPELLVSQLENCLNEQGKRIFCVLRDDKYPGGIFILSSEPFHICLCSAEMDLPCDGPLGHVLSGCPIYNLLDGIGGNETQDPSLFHAGIGIEFEPVTCSVLEDEAALGLTGRIDKASGIDNWLWNE